MALTKIKLDSMVTGNLPDANIPNDITIDTASASPANALTGSALASGVTASSLTSVGTLSSLTTSGKVGINGAIDSSYAGATIHGTSALKTTPGDGSELRFKLYTGGAADASILQMFKADGSTIGVNLHSDGESYFKNSSHSVLTLEAGTNSSASLRLKNDAQHWDVNCQTTDNFAVYNHTTGASALTIAPSTFNATFTGDVGIGAAPRQYYRLDIYKNGNASILGMRSESHGCTIYTQTGTTVTGQIEFSTSQGWITTRTASPLKLGANNAEKLTIGADGNTTFAGQALIKGGASNDLSLAFSGDTDTGLYLGGDGATAFVQNAGIALELQASLTAEFRGLIKHKGTSNSDYGNTAFETRAGNNSQGLKISHGGGNGKLEIFGGNQSRTQFYANQITANVNGLEIKTTDGQSLTLGTNNTTRVTVDSSGNASFAEKILMTSESVIQQAADESKGFMFNGGGGTTFGYPNVQGSGLYGMVFGRESIAAAGGGHYIAKSHWGGISIIGFSGSGVQGIDIVAWGYGNGGATVLKGGNWVGSLYRSYSTVNYHLVVDVGTDVTMFSILIGI